MKKKTLKTMEDKPAQGEMKLPEEAKSKKPKGDKQLDPHFRKSVFNKRFMNSKEEDWKKFDDFYVHHTEMDAFNLNYRKCAITNKYHPVSSMLKFHLGGIVVKTLVDGNDYVICNQSALVFPKKNTFEAYDNNGAPVHVSLDFKSDFGTCTFSGKVFMNGHMAKIKKSKKYGLVASPYLSPEHGFQRCSECGNWFEKDECKWYEDYGQWMCETCMNKKKFQNVIHAYNDKSYPAPMYSVIERYGHKVGTDGVICATNKKTPVKSVRLFGAEAEVELCKPAVVALGGTRHTMAYHVRECLGKDFAAIKEDGTLTLNGKYSGDSKYDPDGTKDGPNFAGFEIVTAPADIQVHRAKWALMETCKELHDAKGNRLLRAWDTDTCGFHVHISRDALSELQIGRMLRFVNHRKNAKFIQKIAGRGSDTYCRYLDKEFVDVLHPDRVISQEEKDAYNRKRRVALNISNEKTVEFRIFRGTIHPAHIIRNIVFCDAVCDYCFPAARSLSDMDDYGKFIEFVSRNRKLYPELAAWFVLQKQITLKKIGEGANPAKFTIHPDMVPEPDHKSVPEPEPPKPEPPAVKPKQSTFAVSFPQNDAVQAMHAAVQSAKAKAVKKVIAAAAEEANETSIW